MRDDGRWHKKGAAQCGRANDGGCDASQGVYQTALRLMLRYTSLPGLAIFRWDHDLLVSRATLISRYYGRRLRG